eukprot:Rmarinus@m.24211
MLDPSKSYSRLGVCWANNRVIERYKKNSAQEAVTKKRKPKLPSPSNGLFVALQENIEVSLSGPRNATISSSPRGEAAVTKYLQDIYAQDFAQVHYPDPVVGAQRDVMARFEAKAVELQAYSSAARVAALQRVGASAPVVEEVDATDAKQQPVEYTVAEWSCFRGKGHTDDWCKGALHTPSVTRYDPRYTLVRPRTPSYVQIGRPSSAGMSPSTPTNAAEADPSAPTNMAGGASKSSPKLASMSRRSSIAQETMESVVSTDVSAEMSRPKTAKERILDEAERIKEEQRHTPNSAVFLGEERCRDEERKHRCSFQATKAFQQDYEVNYTQQDRHVPYARLNRIKPEPTWQYNKVYAVTDVYDTDTAVRHVYRQLPRSVPFRTRPSRDSPLGNHLASRDAPSEASKSASHHRSYQTDVALLRRPVRTPDFDKQQRGHVPPRPRTATGHAYSQHSLSTNPRSDTIDDEDGNQKTCRTRSAVHSNPTTNDAESRCRSAGGSQASPAKHGKQAAQKAGPASTTPSGSERKRPPSRGKQRAAERVAALQKELVGDDSDSDREVTTDYDKVIAADLRLSHRPRTPTFSMALTPGRPAAGKKRPFAVYAPAWEEANEAHEKSQAELGGPVSYPPRPLPSPRGLIPFDKLPVRKSLEQAWGSRAYEVNYDGVRPKSPAPNMHMQTSRREAAAAKGHMYKYATLQT